MAKRATWAIAREETVERGELPAARVGSLLRIAEVELDAYWRRS